MTGPAARRGAACASARSGLYSATAVLNGQVGVPGLAPGQRWLSSWCKPGSSIALLRNTGGAAASRRATARSCPPRSLTSQCSTRQRHGRGLQRQRGRDRSARPILSPRRNSANRGCPIRSSGPPEISPEIAACSRRAGRGARRARGRADPRVRLAERRRAQVVAPAPSPPRARRGGAVVAHLDVTAEQAPGNGGAKGAARARAHEHARRHGRAGVGGHPRNDPIADRLARQRAGAQADAPRPRVSAARTWRRSSTTSSTPTGDAADVIERDPPAHAQRTIRHAAGRSQRHRHGHHPGAELFGGQRRGRCWWRTSIPTSRRSRRPRAAPPGGDEPDAQCGAGDAQPCGAAANGAGRQDVGAEHAWVTVEDAGPGIPADALPRLFEPVLHDQGERARAWVCRSAVRSSNPTAAPSPPANVPQGGARFTVILPARLSRHQTPAATCVPGTGAAAAARRAG